MTPAETLTSRLKGAWHQRFGTAPCPAHEDANPSLSIRDGEHGIIFKCFAGCTSRDVVAELRRRHLWPVEGSATPSSDAGPDKMRAAALRIWVGAGPIAATIGDLYLRGRAISIPLPPTLRYAGALKHQATGLLLPAMVAAVQSGERRIIAVHRTYLTATGRKAPLTANKMALGALDDGAVRLAAAGPELGLAEGVETGLSAMQLFGIPTWCSLGAERLCKIAVPDKVKRVIIFADGDAPGQAAAMKAVSRYTKEGRHVTLRTPPAQFADFNDLLQAQGVAV